MLPFLWDLSFQKLITTAVWWLGQSGRQPNPPNQTGLNWRTQNQNTVMRLDPAPG
jgi:hypothetical protein